MTIIGLIVGISAVIFGVILEGGDPSFLFQLTAFVIVFGGTLGATMTQTCPDVFLRALMMFPKAIFRAHGKCELTVPNLWEWRRITQHGTNEQIDQLILSQENPFHVKVIEVFNERLKVDRAKEVLELEIEQSHEDGIQVVQVYESMGGYSPTIGIIGAILGLIQVMHNNMTDPQALGEGIAVAFVATIYGVGFANLIYIPIAEKIRALVILRSRYHEMVMAGAISILMGDHLEQFDNKIDTYVSRNREDIAIPLHPKAEE